MLENVGKVNLHDMGPLIILFSNIAENSIFVFFFYFV